MSRLIRNKKLIGSTSNDSSHIIYDPSDTSRSETTVKSELDRLNAGVPAVDVGTAVTDWTNTETATSANQGSDNYTTLNAMTPSSTIKSLLTSIKSLLFGLSTQVTNLNSSLTVYENEYKETVYKVYMSSTVSGNYASGAVLGTFSNIPKGIYRVYQIGSVSQYGGYLVVVSGTVKSINYNGTESAAMSAGYLHDYPTIKIESDTATLRITSPSALTYYAYYVILEKVANVDTELNVTSSGQSSNVKELKTGTLTGTTGTYGGVISTLPIGSVAIVDCYSDGNNHVCIPYHSGTGDYIYFSVRGATDYAPISNTSVTLTYHYYELN